METVETLFIEVLLQSNTENREVSSAKSFTVDSMSSDKSFIYIRKTCEPRIHPCDIFAR